MQSRVLPLDEWPRLVGTELECLMEAPEAARSTIVIVVEDEQGAIIACWAAMALLHVEGLWIAPAHRGRTGAARALLRKMRAVAAEHGVTKVITGALDPIVTGLLEHAGASPVPGQAYVLPLSAQKEIACPQR